MDKQNRRAQWREEWKELFHCWESKLLFLAWAAALVFVIGMAAGGVLSHWNASPGREAQKPVLDVVFTQDRPVEGVYIAEASPSLRPAPAGIPGSFEWPYSA